MHPDGRAGREPMQDRALLLVGRLQQLGHHAARAAVAVRRELRRDRGAGAGLSSRWQAETAQHGAMVTSGTAAKSTLAGRPRPAG